MMTRVTRTVIAGGHELMPPNPPDAYPEHRRLSEGYAYLRVSMRELRPSVRSDAADDRTPPGDLRTMRGACTPTHLPNVVCAEGGWLVRDRLPLGVTQEGNVSRK